MKWLILAVLFPGAAWANNHCAPTETAYQMLKDRYGEERIFTGTANGNVIELWMSAETGTFTAFVSLPNGTSCIVSEGDNAAIFAIPPNT